MTIQESTWVGTSLCEVFPEPSNMKKLMMLADGQRLLTSNGNNSCWSMTGGNRGWWCFTMVNKRLVIVDSKHPQRWTERVEWIGSQHCACRLCICCSHSQPTTWHFCSAKGVLPEDEVVQPKPAPKKLIIADRWIKRSLLWRVLESFGNVGKVLENFGKGNFSCLSAGFEWFLLVWWVVENFDKSNLSCMLARFWMTFTCFGEFWRVLEKGNFSLVLAGFWIIFPYWNLLWKGVLLFCSHFNVSPAVCETSNLSFVF